MGMPNKEHTKMQFLDFDMLLSLKDGDILFFDELPNGNPVVLNACLTLLEDRVMISGKKLANIMIVAAGNYEGMQPMTAPQKRRFEWFDVKFNRSMWQNYMLDKFMLPKNISAKLCDLIHAEKFTGYNFNTPADLDKAVETIICGVPSAYDKTVKLILESLVGNKLKEPVELPNGKKLEVGEQMKWLDLIKINNGTMPFDVEEEEELIASTYEVILEGTGFDKLNVIERLASLTGKTQGQTQDLLKSIPVRIIETDANKAIYFQTKLQKAGAIVTILPKY